MQARFLSSLRAFVPTVLALLKSVVPQSPGMKARGRGMSSALLAGAVFLYKRHSN